MQALICEDKDRFRASLADELRAHGYEVEAVADGYSAVALAVEQRPDLIVTDVQHPGIDGTALVQAVRDAGVESRIVVLTRDNYRPVVAAAFRAAGADAFVSKTALIGFENACRGRAIWPID